MSNNNKWDECPVDISDDDIFLAMNNISGYIDITSADFKEIYQIAYQQAIDRLYQSFKAVDIMSQPVIFVQADTTLLETATVMADNNISGIPVVDADHCVVGVISEKDFLREMSVKKYQSFMGVVSHCLNNKGCVAVSLQNKAAKDIMTSSPICVQEDTTILQIANLFDNNNINRVPVIHKSGKMTGIVARSDMIQHFCTIQE